MRAPLVVLAVVAVALSLGAGGAGAQAPGDALTPLETNLQVRLQPSEAPGRPGEELVIPGEVHYTLQPPPGPLVPETRVTLRAVEVPDWAEVTFDPEVLTFQPGQDASPGPLTMTEGFQVRLRVTGLGPAFTPALLGVAAEAAANPPYKASRGEDTMPVQVDYVPALKIVADPDPVPVDGASGEFTLRVANVGNAPTRIRIETLEAPAGVCARPQPETFTLESGLDGPTQKKEVPVNVHAEEGVDDGAVLVLAVWPEYAFDTTLPVAPVRVEVALEDAGVGLRSLTSHVAGPGPGPVVTFGAIGTVLGFVAGRLHALRNRDSGGKS